MYEQPYDPTREEHPFVPISDDVNNSAARINQELMCETQPWDESTLRHQN